MYALPEPEAQDVERPARSRSGLSKSKPGQNAEGRTEAQLKRQSQLDRAFYSNQKKRHRKDLSYEEIKQVLEATKQPYRLHKDIAKEFRIPAILVSRLVKESQLKPEKLEQKQADEILTARKKQVVEETTTAMLASNMPIVRLK